MLREKVIQNAILKMATNPTTLAEFQASISKSSYVTQVIITEGIVRVPQYASNGYHCTDPLLEEPHAQTTNLSYHSPFQMIDMAIYLIIVIRIPTVTVPWNLIR